MQVVATVGAGHLSSWIGVTTSWIGLTTLRTIRLLIHSLCSSLVLFFPIQRERRIDSTSGRVFGGGVSTAGWVTVAGGSRAWSGTGAYNISCSQFYCISVAQLPTVNPLSHADELREPCQQEVPARRARLASAFRYRLPSPLQRLR